MSTRSLLAAALSLAATGCALPVPPVAEAAGRYGVTLCVTNPGPEPLVLHRVAVRLGTGSPAATGFDQDGIVVAPREARRVTLALLARDAGTLAVAARIGYRVDGLVALAGAPAVNVAYRRAGQIERTSLTPAMAPACARSDIPVPL